MTVKTDNGYKGLLLLPQTLNPWITKTGGTDENPEYKITGTARVLVKCKLVDTASDVQLWPDKDSQEETAWVGVSLVGEPKDISGKTEQVWKQGKRYVYTLIFGEGGGFNPENPARPVYFRNLMDEKDRFAAVQFIFRVLNQERWHRDPEDIQQNHPLSHQM